MGCRKCIPMGHADIRARRRKTAEAVGARLRAAREARGLTQSGLAALANTAQSLISRYETAHNSPGVAVLTAMADALDVSAGWLLTGEGEGPAEAA